ncbi:hypothetical protein DFP72DRAFT_889484 [Ephemerocybe angulata]|uniref:Uncharacterized protein n=1 Tax=Ephemerocybe angulata TaxID=980116 RepID=A0A8H6I2Y3_9AGAR|nr:hypothetical protein DFP72DRAFT_889484 [Tulosesus angulatus]
MSTELKERHWAQFMAVYDDLPNEFLPWNLLQPVGGSRWTVSHWVDNLLARFPRDTIPPKLRLRKGLSFQPPRFLFGWAMSSDVLFNIAQRHNFLPPDTPPDCNPRALYWKEMVLPLNAVLRKQFPEIMARLPGYALITPVMTAGWSYHQCIVLADSYATGNSRPSLADINTLKEFLGIGEGSTQALADNQAKWWLDYGQTAWEYMDSRQFDAISRPWLKEVRELQSK